MDHTQLFYGIVCSSVYGKRTSFTTNSFLFLVFFLNEKDVFNMISFKSKGLNQQYSFKLKCSHAVIIY